MFDKNLLCVILTFIVIVLLFKIFNVERFYSGLDYNEYKRTRTRLLNELKTEVESSLVGSTGNKLLSSDELKAYIENTIKSIDKNVDDDTLNDFLKIEDRCIQNQEYISTTKSS